MAQSSPESIALPFTITVSVRSAVKNRKDNLTDYPVERAIADAIVYHDNCSLVAGLEQAALSIERAVNPGLNELKKFKEMEKVLTSGFKKDEAGDTLRSFWKPDGTTINAQNQTKLREWMRANAVDPLSIAFFIRNEMFADARVQAVKDLNLN